MVFLPGRAWVGHDRGDRVELDAGHKYTPGQKFAYWEHLGIQMRIEVGPKEAENRTCIMAWTKTPGEYATVRKETGVPLTKQAILEKAVEMGMQLGQKKAAAAAAVEEDAGSS